MTLKNIHFKILAKNDKEKIITILRQHYYPMVSVVSLERKGFASGLSPPLFPWVAVSQSIELVQNNENLVKT